MAVRPVENHNCIVKDNSMPTESSQWRKFLQPVVTGLAALMAAVTAYFQRSDSSDMDSRMTAIEVEVKNIQPWKMKVDNNIDNLRVMLSDIRADVSFVRGKLEDK